MGDFPLLTQQPHQCLHVGLGDKTAAAESALHLAGDELAAQALFELLHPNALAAQQTFVKRRVKSAIALEIGQLADNLAQVLIAHAVAPGLGIAKQQGLFDEAVHHQLLELRTFRRFRVEPAAELLERRAVGALGMGSPSTLATLKEGPASK